jgi:hypothetical protein
MRKAILLKQVFSSVVALSMSTAFAAGTVDAKRRASIDKEIAVMATSAKKNSVKRVETAKARKAREEAARKAREESARIAKARQQEQLIRR